MLIWIGCYHGFLLGQRSFDSDALAYYDSTKFLTENMAQGVYPLWDPTENSGVPNEFFLRRMGAYNPLYGIMVILRWCGLSHYAAYVTFLTIYWFVGLFGFWWLAQRLFKDARVSLMAYLLLMFSSLGTRLFDSYIVLTLVPLIWFFGFLVAACQVPKRQYVLGLVLSVMLLVTTYIPLYFLNIFIIFFICFIAIFPDRLKQVIKTVVGFIRQNKCLTILLCAIVGIALCPAYSIFKSAGQGDFVMPIRGQTTESDHALQVGKSMSMNWAIMEEFVYTKAYSDLRRFKFAVIFVPGVACFILLLGLMAPVTRKLVFLFFLGAVLTLMGIPGLTPLYEWCHENIFYFKYFRNLHWFFWLAILPIFVLFVAGQFQQILYDIRKTSQRRDFWMYYSMAVVIWSVIYLVRSGDALISTYISLAVMVGLIGLLVGLKRQMNAHLVYGLLFLAISIQALEVYSHLKKNAVKHDGPYKYDSVIMDFDYLRHHRIHDRKSGVYYATSYFNELNDALPPRAFNGYRRHKLILYDQVEYMDPANPNYNKMAAALQTKMNVAFVDDSAAKNQNRGASRSPMYQPVEGDSDVFRVARYNANRLEIHSNLSAPKFLVYTDSYTSDWQVLINKEPTDLIRANHAFKGVWIPAGEQQIIFKYGVWSKKLLNYIMFSLSYGLLGCIILVWYYDLKSSTVITSKNVAVGGES